MSWVYRNLKEAIEIKARILVNFYFLEEDFLYMETIVAERV
jgi:hypothetical protein